MAAMTPDPGSTLTAVLLQITQHAERIAALDHCCTYFARVGASEALILIMGAPISPALAVERFSRVLAVFDKVMGPPYAPPSGSGGSPEGAASVEVAKAWDHWAKQGPQGPIADDPEP